MNPIRKLDELAQRVKNSASKKIAVACGEDSNTLGALNRAVEDGFVKAILFGNELKIKEQIFENKLKIENFKIVNEPDENQATKLAVKAVKDGEADILMKGLVGTDKFLKAVLDKDNGLMLPKAVMSYVCAIEIPKYHKLLFITDTAVIPYPDLEQKIAMTQYAVNMAQKFGIPIPKVALISSAEKVNPKTEHTVDYSLICKMADRGQIKNCIIDGPLDVFCACDEESCRIKGVNTPINGDADVLVFPSLESCNSFYKGLMLFGGGELAGLIQGTEKPVVVMSRSESENSKYYCIALACLMA